MNIGGRFGAAIMMLGLSLLLSLNVECMLKVMTRFA
jgi:hypothetical protein